MGTCASAEDDGGRKRRKKHGEKKRKKKTARGEESGKKSHRDTRNSYAQGGTIDVPIVTLDVAAPQPILKQSSQHSASGFSDFAPASALQQVAEAAAAAAAVAAADEGSPLTPGGAGKVAHVGRSSTVSFNLPEDDEGKIADEAKASTESTLAPPPPPLVIESQDEAPDGTGGANPLLPTSVVREPVGSAPVTADVEPPPGGPAPSSPPPPAASTTGPSTHSRPNRPAHSPLQSSRLKPSFARVVIQGQLYDLEPLLPNHPGGPDILRSFNGRDATKSFVASHSPNPPWQALEKYLVASAEL